MRSRFSFAPDELYRGIFLFDLMFLFHVKQVFLPDARENPSSLRVSISHAL